MAFSDKTLTIPVAGEISTTDRDMKELFEWELGDAEPTGTHAKNYAPHRRLRNDLKQGKRDAKVYEHNMVFIDTFGSLSEQLNNLR